MDKGSIPVPRREEVLPRGNRKKKLCGRLQPGFLLSPSGLQEFIQSYSRPLLDRIRFGERVMRIDRQKKKVVTTTAAYAYDNLISTMPLRELLGMINPRHPFPGSSCSTFPRWWSMRCCPGAAAAFTGFIFPKAELAVLPGRILSRAGTRPPSIWKKRSSPGKTPIAGGTVPGNDASPCARRE